MQECEGENVIVQECEGENARVRMRGRECENARLRECYDTMSLLKLHIIGPCVQYIEKSRST